MGATFGRNIRMTIFGESHGKAIGLVLDGLPPGTPIDEEFIKKEMARRAPGQNRMSTQRQEKDAFIIESGVFEGKAADSQQRPTFQRLQYPEGRDASRACRLCRQDTV